MLTGEKEVTWKEDNWISGRFSLLFLFPLNLDMHCRFRCLLLNRIICFVLTISVLSK